MKRVHVITMWTGGRPAKKWKSFEQPELLPSGTGVKFVNSETKLPVQVIGNISIEDFESGRAELELALGKDWVRPPADVTESKSESESESESKSKSKDNISDFIPREP